MQLLYVILFSVSLLLFACSNKEAEEIPLLLPAQDDDFGLYYTDTITIHTSTVLMDSINTTNSGYLVAGRYEDDRVGPVSANSYFGVGLSNKNLSVSQTAVFDSLVLLLDYEKYAYGDTTRTQSLAVHILTGPLSGTQYYGFDQAEFTPAPVGIRQFRATPYTQVPLHIRLSDTFGKELFALAKEGQVSSQEKLKDFLPGLVLVTGKEDNGAILQFAAESDSSVIKLYYHENKQDVEKLSYDFSIGNGGVYFTQYTAKRDNTALHSLQQSLQAVAAGKTNEETFIQAGTGLRTRIDFPHIRQMNELGAFAVNSAELIIIPVEKTYSSKQPLPGQLQFYIANNSNHISSQLTDVNANNNLVYAYLKEDYITNTKYYSCNLTDYIMYKIKDNSTRNEGLILSLDAGTNQNTAGRIVIGSQANKSFQTRLRIYFTRVQQ